MLQPFPPFLIFLSLALGSPFLFMFLSVSLRVSSVISVISVILI